MTANQLWHDIGSGRSFGLRLIRFLFLLLALDISYFFAVLPLTWPQQAVCGLLMIIIGLAVGRSSDSYLVTLTLMIMSLFATFRYGYWRLSQTWNFFQDPSNHWGALDAFFIFLLIFAESYAFLILFLGYFQTIWPLRRAPMPLPEDTSEWPHVDILIPTYNEPLEVVRYTALGALNIDWPTDKLHVYILDDGRRKEFQEFAFQAGIGYKIRPDNFHAKAGNINTALKSLKSPFVAIFDCDHVPTRSYLQVTMGWFLRDQKLAMVQTPHHFYSADPFERNLGQFRIIPNEGELFYGIVQDGNDFWNAAFFCGSCATIRRKALDQIGGIAVETVTEDAHTSLRMQSRGWNTAYINIPQAAGLATERLSAHVGQRIRWARGMIQILRVDNPLFIPGLKFEQRLCYFNAMMHFMYALPRLIFLTAPLIYLLLSDTNVPGYWAAILAYALPHLTLSNITNSRVQGKHRHSFWNEIYETILSPYILLPTLLAFINPKLGKFNVTAKGGLIKRSFFDRRIAQPFLALLFFNFMGLLISIPRFFIWDRDRPGTVIMNLIWCFLNIVVLGVCVAVSREMQQLRQHVRVRMVTEVEIVFQDGRRVRGTSIDASSGGTSLRLPIPAEISEGEFGRISFANALMDGALPVSVVSVEGTLLRLRFEEMNIQEQELLTTILYSRADTWLGWGEGREVDQPMRSLGRIFVISFRGLRMMFGSLLFPVRNLPGRKKQKSKPAVAARAASLLLAVALLVPALLGLASGTAHAAVRHPAGGLHPALKLAAAQSASASSPAAAARAAAARAAASLAQQAPASGATGMPARQVSTLPVIPPPPPGQFHDLFTLKQVGSGNMELRGIDTQTSVFFNLKQTHVVRTAKMHLSYSFSPALLPQLSHIRLLMNGTLFATIQYPPNENTTTGARDMEADFDVPADLLVRRNQFTVEFIGHYTMVCEDPANTALWARVNNSSYLEVAGDVLPLTDDLKQLPLPFLDRDSIDPPKIPIVFASAPSLKGIQAAGIVASYFGMESESRPAQFPTYIGALPEGDSILIAENPSMLPGGLNLNNVTQPTVAMRPNPNDTYSKVLIITGANADQALLAAQAVAMRSDLLQGPTSTISKLILPNISKPDDAPRWARTDQTISLWDYATVDALQNDGSAPLNVYFRIPPDIFFVQKPNAILKMVYRYNSIPIGPISSIQVRVNNAFLGSLPLIPGPDPARVVKTEVPVPVVNLRPFSNSLSFDFTFQLLKKGGCNDSTPINMQGAIMRDSYLDLRGYPHYASLPNLELFSNAGFPFTRFADLSQTTVVLPPTPTAQEIELFATLMGHFSRQTGMPVLRVSVATADAMKQGADTDFLVLGTGEDQPAFDRIGSALPVNIRAGQVQVRDTLGLLTPLHHAWWKIPTPDHSESGELTASGVPDSVIEGIESPYKSGRTVVVINIKDPTTYTTFIDTFLKVQQSSDISGTVTVLHGSDFQSFRIGNSVYHVGMLPWWNRLTLWFVDVPWLAAILVTLIAFLLAVWTRIWLREHARKRLQMEG